MSAARFSPVYPFVATTLLTVACGGGSLKSYTSADGGRMTDQGVDLAGSETGYEPDATAAPLDADQPMENEDLKTPGDSSATLPAPQPAPRPQVEAQSPANKAKDLHLLFSYDAYWKELLQRGETNPSVYHNNTGHNDPRNKCVKEGCTRTIAWFDGRATMKFTTHAGYNYSASAPDGGQVTQTNTYFARHTGKSYSELMHTVDLLIPASANFYIPVNLYSVQDNAGKIGRPWDTCKISGKGPIGLLSGQVNPLPPPGGLEDGWQYVFRNGRRAASAITGPATFQFGNRECSGFYNQFRFPGSVGWWGPDSVDYMGVLLGQPKKDTVFPRDRWVTVEMYGKLDTNGTNGILELYFDGEQVLRNTSVDWGGARGWRFVGFGGLYMWGGAGDHMVARDTTSVYYSNERVFGK